MTTLILLLFFLALFGIIFKMHFNFQKSNHQHSQNLKNLNGQLIDLLKNQDSLYRKISIATEFNENYKESRKVLAVKIVELISDFLKFISEKT